MLAPYIGLAIFAVIALLFSLKVKNSGKSYGQQLTEYFNMEHEASLVRKKEIPEELFYAPDLSVFFGEAREETNDIERLGVFELDFYKEDEYNVYDLPTKEKCLARIEKLAQKKLMRLPRPMSNREIRFEYGAANFDLIVEYEDNLNKYIDEVNALAGFYIAENDYAAAEKALNAAVSARSDVSKTYILLADVYNNNADTAHERLNDLYEKTLDMQMATPAREKVLSYIERLLNVNMENGTNRTSGGETDTE
ncbi:hypothetical protein FACS189490_01740 [Clostridia bacterium]|nr:hypothetical protein FACS189490_01740 [Clostridia bacterium]